MIPSKIEDFFIELTTDYSGIIETIISGKFAKKEFILKDLIYKTCPFLEGTLDVLPLREPFLLEGMVIVSDSEEFNVDIDLFKNDATISITIHNRTNVYKFVDQLNQNRNDIFLAKREIEEKNKELYRLREIADRANEEKSRFLAMMSHEIRNPLNSILAYTDMISKENINENVKEHISFLSFAGNNLKVIVEDILDLSRIEAGKLELISEQISIHKIVEICVNNFKHQQKDNQVELQFSISEKLPKIITGDSVRLTQILSNLISNAIKFTKSGSIHTGIDVFSETEEIIVIRFQIADTGRGMSEAQVSKIFEEYQQVELDDNRIHGGAGLGLAIVKRLVSAMNGIISVDSVVGLGTTFSIEIPFSKSNNLTIDEKGTVSKTKTTDLTGKKILVADDDQLNQIIVSHILKTENVNVTIVNDGLEAFSKIKEESFDFILLDINMPNMSGDELILQKDFFKEHNAQTPFLALTGNAIKEDIARYIKLGFVEVISKPYTAVELIDKIKGIELPL